MAYLKWGACAAFVVGAAHFCGPVRAAVEAEAYTTQCLLGLNLARTARLDTRVGVLTRNQAEEATVVNAIVANNLAGGDENNCAVNANLTPVSQNVLGFMAVYPHDSQSTCAAFIQAALSSSLDDIGNYEEQPWNNGAAAPYNSPSVQNLAYLMYPDARTTACARTNNCAAGNNILLCRFQPSITAAFVQPPFTADLMKALKARAAKGIDITKLAEGDLNTPLESGGSANAGLGVAPGAVSAVAITVTSILGFLTK